MMKTLMRPFLLVALLASGFLSGCKKDSDSFPSLVGTWQLTNRVCYCPPAPLPNEMVEFTKSEVTFYQDGKPTVHGTYAFTMSKACGRPDAIPSVRFAFMNADAIPQDIKVTVSGNKLILDYGSGCLADAVVDTYERL